MFDCNCMEYNDKLLTIGALIREKNRLGEAIKDSDIDVIKRINIPEYEDLISRIENIPECKVK